MHTNIYERKIDELGRIVLPIEFRKTLSLETGDALSMTFNEESSSIELKKSN